MFDCLILGDSIAEGTKMVMPSCVTYSKVGINSAAWNKKYLAKDLSAPKVIISLGTNDDGIDTYSEIKKMRLRVSADRVYWIMPAIKPHIQVMVTRVAAEFDDIVLPITGLAPDKIHPTPAGYRELAKKISTKHADNNTISCGPFFEALAYHICNR
jgi:lysophospholipase L1-like esterase